MERVYYNNNGVKVREIMTKKTNGMNIRRNLKPYGDKEGNYSTCIGDEVKFEWIQSEDYIYNYGPKNSKDVSSESDEEDISELEKRILMEIRKEEQMREEKAKKNKPVYKKVEPTRAYDKKTVLILNTDKRVCEYDIYEICKKFGKIKYIYNTDSNYNNIVFVTFYDESSGIDCYNGICKKVYKGNMLETQFMVKC